MEKNVALAPLTTFKIGGTADYFCRVKNMADLEEAVKFAEERKLPTFFLGGGSNLVVSDEGFRGLVLKVEISGTEIFGNEIVAGAGEGWDVFVSLCLEKNLFGLENLSGIPGTVGGAAVQNIGAYGVEVKDFIKWVEVLNVESGEIKKFLAGECHFSYRDSFFKSSEGRKWVIVRVCFVLNKEISPNINYKDLAGYFSGGKTGKISAGEVRKAVLEIRAKKFPPLDKFGTAGSFFKNPIVSENEVARLIERYPGLPFFDAGSGRKKISLAWIIDKVCGLKGLKVGGVEVSKEQALVLLSAGKASSSDVFGLAEKIRKEVFEKTGVRVEFEAEFL